MNAWMQCYLDGLCSQMVQIVIEVARFFLHRFWTCRKDFKKYCEKEVPGIGASDEKEQHHFGATWKSWTADFVQRRCVKPMQMEVGKTLTVSPQSQNEVESHRRVWLKCKHTWQKHKNVSTTDATVLLQLGTADNQQQHFSWVFQQHWFSLGCPTHCGSTTWPSLILAYLLGLFLWTGHFSISWDLGVATEPSFRPLHQLLTRWWDLLPSCLPASRDTCMIERFGFGGGAALDSSHEPSQVAEHCAKAVNRMNVKACRQPEVCPSSNMTRICEALCCHSGTFVTASESCRLYYFLQSTSHLATQISACAWFCEKLLCSTSRRRFTRSMNEQNKRWTCRWWATFCCTGQLAKTGDNAQPLTWPISAEEDIACPWTKASISLMLGKWALPSRGLNPFWHLRHDLKLVEAPP